jgi:hypothetical protein
MVIPRETARAFAMTFDDESSGIMGFSELDVVEKENYNRDNCPRVGKSYLSETRFGNHGAR